MMNVIDNGPGTVVMNANELAMMEEEAMLLAMEEEKAALSEMTQSSLASHITGIFQDNKDARTSSGVEKKMLESLRAYNGHYDPEDKAKIKQSGGSDIYMNITPTKCRAAISWIRDILMPAMENAWSLQPTPLPEVPMETKEKIKATIEAFIEEDEPEQPQEQQAGPDGQPQPQQQAKPNPVDAATKMREQNQLQLDLEEAIQDEIYKIATKEVNKFEVKIADELAEGGWEHALSEFIEDFCVFQVAVLKGPVITKKKRLEWQAGQPVEIEDFIFANKRVSPLDIYPSASAVDMNDGDLCEHIRMHRKELYNLIGTEGYHEVNIRELLATSMRGSNYTWLDSYIENEKTVEEYRGDTYRANKNVYHGIHFFGTASWEQLYQYGFSMEVLGTDEQKEFDVEAILIGNKVIKAEIVDDPLLRRPYYKASFQNIPGSWWGRSLPELMRDIQRLCNATARALSNNMGIASGPQVEVNIDRLAADEEIESMYPWKLWQTTNDPSGSGGKAISFFQPSSNAGELLSVYKEFEIRADDATGIPRYAYGNERTGGAAQTASGLSMLLESASKGIKDAIRHIDDGLIKPRVEYQFYWDMISDPDADFTGDIKVVPKGSQALTMRGAQEMRRNEFLQILASPQFTQIVGMEGIAEILREMSKTLGLGENIVPSRIELRYKQKKAAQQAQEQQAAQQKAEQEKGAVGVQQVQMQTSQAEQASMRNAQLKAKELEDKQKNAEVGTQLRVAELELRREETADKKVIALTKQQMINAQKDNSDNKSIALSVQSNYQDKSNKE